MNHLLLVYLTQTVWKHVTRWGVDTNLLLCEHAESRVLSLHGSNHPTPISAQPHIITNIILEINQMIWISMNFAMHWYYLWVHGVCGQCERGVVSSYHGTTNRTEFDRWPIPYSEATHMTVELHSRYVFDRHQNLQPWWQWTYTQGLSLTVIVINI